MSCMSAVEARLSPGRHQKGDCRRHSSLDDRAVIFQGVLARASRAGDWRTGVQNPSFDRGGMEGNIKIVGRKRLAEFGQMLNKVKGPSAQGNLSKGSSGNPSWMTDATWEMPCVPSRFRRLLLVSFLVWFLLHCWSGFLVEYGRRWFPDTEKKVLGFGTDQG